MFAIKYIIQQAQETKLVVHLSAANILGDGKGVAQAIKNKLDSMFNLPHKAVLVAVTKLKTSGIQLKKVKEETLKIFENYEMVAFDHHKPKQVKDFAEALEKQESAKQYAVHGWVDTLEVFEILNAEKKMMLKLNPKK